MKIQIPTASIESGKGYVKFPDGTLICYGQVTALAKKDNILWEFPIPFIKEPIVLATHQWSYENKGSVTVGKLTKENVGIHIYDDYNGINLDRQAFVSAIGRWK
ncbi:hypothetical protein [Amedibacterium intestinale]|uniref:hypothetical protein n=1 Tax=Amedibacterium intestinale TaxID=2583452 RepID=UPI000E2026E3